MRSTRRPAPRVRPPREAGAAWRVARRAPRKLQIESAAAQCPRHRDWCCTTSAGHRRAQAAAAAGPVYRIEQARRPGVIKAQVRDLRDRHGSSRRGRLAATASDKGEGLAITKQIGGQGKNSGGTGLSGGTKPGCPAAATAAVSLPRWAERTWAPGRLKRKACCADRPRRRGSDPRARRPARPAPGVMRG